MRNILSAAVTSYALTSTNGANSPSSPTKAPHETAYERVMRTPANLYMKANPGKIRLASKTPVLAYPQAAGVF